MPEGIGWVHVTDSWGSLVSSNAGWDSKGACDADIASCNSRSAYANIYTADWTCGRADAASG